MQSQMENYPVPSRFQSDAKGLGFELAAQKKTDRDMNESRVLFARFPDGRPTESQVYPYSRYDEEAAFTSFLAWVELVRSRTTYPLSQDFQDEALRHGLKLRAWTELDLHSAEDMLYVEVLTAEGEPLRTTIRQDKFDIGEEKDAVETAIKAGKEMLANR